MKAYINTKADIQMFIIALYKIAQNWKHIFINKRMNKQIVHYPYNGLQLISKTNKQTKDYSVQTWVNLKIMMPSERSQEKRMYMLWFHLRKCLENAN